MLCGHYVLRAQVPPPPCFPWVTSLVPVLGMKVRETSWIATSLPFTTSFVFALNLQSVFFLFNTAEDKGSSVLGRHLKMCPLNLTL